MDNNSFNTNKRKTSSKLKLLNTKNNENPGSGLGQAQKCGGVQTG